VFGGLARFEWLLFEVAVVGWACWELWSLRRDRLRDERRKAAEAEAPPHEPPRGAGG
jgi:hypothetical protein